MFSTEIRLDLKNRIQKAIPLLPYVLLLLLLTKHAANSPNDQSRLATMESLVEQGTFAIDDSTFKDTVDKIFVNGHFYSGKPPVLSFLGAGFYFILHHVFRLSISDSLTYYSLTLLLVGVPSILMLVFFSKSLAFTRLDPKDRWIITYALGGGTLILSYSVVLNNHTVAASLLCLAFYCWLRIKQLPYNQSKFLFGAGIFKRVSRCHRYGGVAFCGVILHPFGFADEVCRLGVHFGGACSLCPARGTECGDCRRYLPRRFVSQ